MKILITGANGMLGQDLSPMLEDSGYETIETDIQTLDVTNYSKSKDFIFKNKPDIIIHCAAYTNVDSAEDDKENAEKINVFGTENIAKICKSLDIPIVYISTDYVFDGKNKEPITTDTKPNPINIYGQTKYLGEQKILENCEKYYIIRTSWLYGIHGKNFVKTMLSLKNKEIKVVNDEIGSPTWSVELSSGIIEILNKPYGIYHISGEGETNWYEFAKEIFKQCNIKANITPISAKEYGAKAKRPQYSVLKNSVICRNWKKALYCYLQLEDL